MNIQYIPFCMIALISFTVYIQIKLKKSDNNFENIKDDFLELEAKANKTRIKSIDPALFITPDILALPFSDYPDLPKYKKIIKKQELVKRKSELKMLYFPELLTNTEIKLTYGANNFDLLIMYEEHYNGYIRSLSEWGEELISLNNIDSAEIVLLEAVKLHSDISKPYLLLANIYNSNKNYEMLNFLIDSANSSRLTLKEKVISEIKNYFPSEVTTNA